MEQQSHILEKTNELFFTYGVKNFTMDDLSKELGISKKTIYEAFESKNELVSEVLMLNIRFYTHDITEKMDNSYDAIHEFYQIMMVVNSMFKKMTPNFIYEVQKYYPRAWKQYTEFRNGFIKDAVNKNLKRGKREGLYRKDLKLDIVSRYRLEQVDCVFDKESFPPEDFNMAEVMTEISKLFILGVCTVKGHNKYFEYEKDYQLHATTT